MNDYFMNIFTRNTANTQQSNHKLIKTLNLIMQ